MSREFGEYHSSGYFHTKIASAYEDCRGAKYDLTKLWGSFLEEFQHVAYEISNAEAGDSGEATMLLENIKRMKLLKTKFQEVELYLESYEQFLEEALRYGNLDVSKRKSK